MNLHQLLFHCTVDTTPPTPVFSGCPSAAIIATDPAVFFQVPSARDADTRELLPVSCSPAPGTTFAEQNTSVTCSASDAVGNVAPQKCNFNVQLGND